jgi:hypothetical protein
MEYLPILGRRVKAGGDPVNCLFDIVIYYRIFSELSARAKTKFDFGGEVPPRSANVFDNMTTEPTTAADDRMACHRVQFFT